MTIGTLVAVFLIFFGTCGADDNEWTYLGLAGDSALCVAVDPANGQVIWAGALTGCWKTTDGGQNWFEPGLFGYPFKEMVVDPDMADWVWGIWGMGSWSDGVFRTTNGGTDWEVSLWMYMGDALVMCPGDHDVLYAAAINPGSPGPGAGIYRTIDHGATWYGEWLGQYSFRSLAVHPTDPDVAYAGCEEGKIFKTTNGGTLWTELPITPLPVLSLTIDSFVPKNLFAAIGAGSFSDGIYRSVNGGASWAVSHWFYMANALASEWRNPEVVYAGSREAGVVRTLDGGSTWSEINTGLTSQDVQYLAVDPSNRRAVYAATDGGIFRYDWAPKVSVALTPDSTVIHPGGGLSYWLSLCNDTDEYQTFWVQATVHLHNGGTVPMAQPVRLTMPPQTCRDIHVAHPVPMGTPPGEYRYRVRIGLPSEGVWDLDSFVVAVELP
jgi:photosystem II stability/assembly factor-like uncharacterized protein